MFQLPSRKDCRRRNGIHLRRSHLAPSHRATSAMLLGSIRHYRFLAAIASAMS
jgi:hypothetical protein